MAVNSLNDLMKKKKKKNEYEVNSLNDLLVNKTVAKTDDIAPVKSTTSKKKKENKITLGDVMSSLSSGAFLSQQTAGGRLLTEDDFKMAGDIKKARKEYYDSDRAWNKGWFKKSEGNTAEAVVGTTADASVNAMTGAVGGIEKAADFFSYLSSGAYLSQQAAIGPLKQEDYDLANEMNKKSAEFIKKDLWDDKEVAKQILAGLGSGAYLGQQSATGILKPEDWELAEQSRQEQLRYLSEDAERYSVLDQKSDSLLQSAGQLGVTAALSSAGVPWWLTTFATSFGGEVETALNEGASYGEAGGSALITAGAEVLSEKLSGGISFGGKTLDEGLTNILAKSITSKSLRALSKVGMDFAGEGFEEVFSSVMGRLGTSLYKEENWRELLTSEEAIDEYIESFISGGVLGGSSSVISAGKSAIAGRDVLTGQTKNEQTVVNKLVEETIKDRESKGEKVNRSEVYDEVMKSLEEGRVDTEKIESILDENTYQEYQDLQKKSEEYKRLSNTTYMNMTPNEQKTYAELEESNSKKSFKDQISDVRTKLSNTVTENDSLLHESYNEKYRKGQSFQADLTKYDSKQAAIVKKAIDVDFLNDSKKTHALVDMIAKVCAEKDLDFDFANNEILKKSGFALEGKRIHGFKQGNKITVNMQSKKVLETIVGHEVTHVLEGDQELYKALASSVKAFGEAKGIYQEMYDRAFEGYKNVYKNLSEAEYKAKIEQEVVADIVGDYIFSDTDFVRNLSTENRNVLQKIYDEIKYFLKKVTTGSDEEKKLLEAKKIFEDVYREIEIKAENTENADVQYSIVDDQETIDFLENQEHITVYKSMSLIDGKLYPPMASQEYVEEEYTTKKGEKKTRRVRKLKTPSELGKWQQSDERPDLITKMVKPSKKYPEGYGSFDLLKSNGKVTDGVAYNPYEHTSNLVMNDQFSEAYQRPELVTVEYEIPVSELTSGYKAKFAKDPVGLTDWKAGGVAQNLKNSHRDVYLTRWSKPVRILDDSEVAQKYKEILDKEEGLSIPWNVVNNNLRLELEKAGVPIYYGEIQAGPTKRSFEKYMQGEYGDYGQMKDVQYSINQDTTQRDKDYLDAIKRGDTETAQKIVDEVANESFKNSVIRDDTGKLIKVYHGTNANFTVFHGGEDGTGNYFTPWRKFAEGYGDVRAFYVNLENPIEYDEDFEQLNDVAQEDADGFIYIGEDMRAGVDQDLVGDTEIVVFDPSKIKSADPITYDDNGNVIPLSQRFNAANEDIRYSINEDSAGKELSVGQQEYFKDSKIRDDNGNLKVMYHGSPAQFTVFDKKKAKSSGYYGRGFYFSDSESHAGQYGSKYEVYLNIKNPVQDGTKNITKEQLRNFVNEIAENEDYGIENYGYGATVDSVTDSVWGKNDFAMLMDLNATSIGDMVEAIQLFNEVNGTDYDGIIASTETVAFYPEQIKNTTNHTPTSNKDIRFSLSNNVEESNGLMAIHNLHSNELMKQIEMGGIPYPSIAITNPSKISHDDFGDISIVLNKDSIDPKKSKYNHIYSADAYTPTFPSVRYEANREVADKFSQKVNELYDKIPDFYQRSISAFRDETNFNDRLNSDRGEQGLIESLYDNHGMKQLYLAETSEVVPVQINQTEVKMTDYQIENAEHIIERLGEEAVKKYRLALGFNAKNVREKWFNKYGEQLKNAYAELLSKDLDVSHEEAREMIDGENEFFWVREMRNALKYLENGGTTIKEETDIPKTNALIDEKVDSEKYKQWLNEHLKGVEGRRGIRNNKDMFTSSGKRRSFSQLHDDVTIENVIKAMRKEDQSGQGAFGTGNILGASAQEFSSIDEVRANKNRLGKMSEEEHKKITQKISDDIFEIASRYSAGKDIIDAKKTICEAVAKYETKTGIAKYLKQYDYVYKYDDSIVDDVIELRNYIRSLPTPYFEAKPRRAVGLDEVAVYVIPNNADPNLKNTLLQNGYSIAEYDPNVQGDRQRVLNSFEDLKFSLIDNYEIAPLTGGTYSKDVLLNYESDPAPMQETMQQKSSFAEDYAPLTEEQSNVRDDRQIEEHYFADYVPVEKEEGYNGSYAEHITPNDPFYEKDIWEVGKDRKQKAYMYENPEVKPFFQQEARYMLGELDNSSKGEKFYNDQLYYDTNGEYGFFGTKRHTSEEIAYLLDTFNYTYKDIAKGLNAIIEDNGKENNAISKRIEFLLDERLRLGYKDFWFGDRVPPNQEYINLLNEKQINEYNDEAFGNWVQNLTPEEIDQYFTHKENTAPVPQEYAPIGEVDRMSEDIAPTVEYYSIRPEKPKRSNNEPRMVRVKDSMDQDVEPVVAKILTEEPKAEKTKGRFWSQAMELVGDKGFVFENLSKKTKNRELEAKWNFTRYAQGMAQDFIGNGSDGVRALNDVQKEVENAGLKQELSEYLYHMHNIDRMNLANRYDGMVDKPVFGDSVTSEVSMAAVSELEAKHPELKRYANEIYSINNHLRRLLVEGDVISQETADLWAEMYPHYVPIRRVGDHGLNINVPLDTGRTGINAPIKRATGGNSDILPLFDTMAQRTLQTYRAVARNRFGVELKNTLGTTVGTEATDVDGVIDGLDNHDELLQKGKNGRKPTFTVFEGGEKVTFEITEDMYDALKPVSETLRYTNPVTNAISNFHRNVLTQYNPAFTLRNIIKDTQDVMMNSQHPLKTYANFPKAIKELSTKGKWYKEYLKNGGEQNTYFDNKSNTFVQDKSKFVKAIGMPLNAVSVVNDYIERLPRLAEYIASREAGKSIEVSMLDSARVTTNFAAGGDLTKFLNRNGATFLNASVQGAMQQVRNVREAKMNGVKGWVQLATKCAVASVPVYLLNAMLWDDDEEYEELSDYVKQNYYVVAKFDDGNFVRIPKGRTLSVIQNAFEQTMNALTGNDEVDLQSFTKLVISNLAPNNPFEDHILAPIVQVANNEAWYGGDLVPTRLQDLPKEEQYDESTDDLSRWLGEVTGQSPYKINYLLEQYSGAVGDVLLPMITPEAESGDDTIQGKFVAPLRDAFTTDSVLNNQNISDFYDTVDELTMRANSSKATSEDVLASKYINSVSSEIGKLYGEKRDIQNSDLLDSEKYYLVRDIQKKINALAEESLNKYPNVQITGDYATVGDRQYRLNNGSWGKLDDKQVEKQNDVTQSLGITPSEYWSKKEEYDFAYENKGKYSIAKTVGGYDVYKNYMDELNDLRADKDSSGKSISGSAKAKKQAYIESLDLDYGQKLILHRSLYDSKTDKANYNRAIVEYLDSREDISYEEMVTILEELDMKVHSDGRVTW